MSTIVAAMVLLGAQDAEQRAEQILNRLDDVMATFREETRQGVRRILGEELGRFRRPSASEEEAIAEIRRLAEQIAEDDDTNRTIRRALLNPQAQSEIIQQLSAMQMTPQQATERMFELGDDGRYRVRPEYAEMALAIASAYVPDDNPTPNPNPDPNPNPTPQGRPYLGFRIDDSYQGEGVLVMNVTDASPASEAGLQRGDVVLTIDGSAVTSAGLRTIVTGLRPGQQIQCAVRRGGEDLAVTLTVGSR